MPICTVKVFGCSNCFHSLFVFGQTVFPCWAAAEGQQHDQGISNPLDYADGWCLTLVSATTSERIFAKNKDFGFWFLSPIISIRIMIVTPVTSNSFIVHIAMQVLFLQTWKHLDRSIKTMLCKMKVRQPYFRKILTSFMSHWLASIRFLFNQANIVSDN